MSAKLLWMTPGAVESLRQDVMRLGMSIAPFYEAAGQASTAEHIRCTAKLLAWAPESEVREHAGRLGQLWVNAAFRLPTAGQPGWHEGHQWAHTRVAMSAGV